MSELLRRGMIAALAPAGVPNCDIVVSDNIGDRLCAVQVKTRSSTGADGGWHMGKKHEELVSATLFYCFVDFATGKDCAPFTYVVPASVVAATLTECHQAWLDQPGKKGQQRKDNDLRRFLPDYAHLQIGKYEAGWLQPYFEAWHLLERQAAQDQ
jgi:hypothetical protein